MSSDQDVPSPGCQPSYMGASMTYQCAHHKPKQLKSILLYLIPFSTPYEVCIVMPTEQ